MHVYTSMVCLLLVLFFSATGLTLNHPNWAFGSKLHKTTVSGTLPAKWQQGATIDWFVVDEYLRSTHSLRGEVSDHQGDAAGASISYKGPGYHASAFIQLATGSYELTTEAQGFVAFMNDLHKGRDTNRSWNWLIDVAAVLLIVISLTGLGLQLFLKARRRSAVYTALGGSLIALALIWLAAR